MQRALKTELKRISKLLGYPFEKIPKVNEHNEIAIPYIIAFEKEVLYHYVVNERGQEHERSIFQTLDSLLFHVFSNIAFEMAVKYELENRIENQDCRIIIFKKQEDLIASINIKWGVTIRKDNIKRGLSGAIS